MDDYGVKSNSPTQVPTPKPTMRPTPEKKAPYDRMFEGFGSAEQLISAAKKPEAIVGEAVLVGAVYYRYIRNRNVANVIREQTGNPMGDIEMTEVTPEV